VAAPRIEGPRRIDVSQATHDWTFAITSQPSSWQHWTTSSPTALPVIRRTHASMKASGTINAYTLTFAVLP
jgi:hypothetical protein